MNVTIDLLPGVRNAVIAHGVKALLESMDLGLTVSGAIAETAPAAPAAAQQIPAAAPAPVKQKRKYRLAPKAEPVAPKPAERKAAKPDGVNSDVALAGQHMYLMVRDGLAVRNDTDPATWSLAQ